MTIIDAIKKGLKAAGVNEKYASKVQKLFKTKKKKILLLMLPYSKTIFFLILKIHPQ